MAAYKPSEQKEELFKLVSQGIRSQTILNTLTSGGATVDGLKKRFDELGLTPPPANHGRLTLSKADQAVRVFTSVQ